MPKVHLTDIVVRALKAPASGQTTYLDASMPGFGIRVSQGGAKTWTVVHGRNRRRITIGRYPVVSLQLARSEARRVLAEAPVARGIQSMRFDDALSLFLSTHCAVKNRPGTAKQTTRLLQRHFLPGLHNRLLHEITTQDFVAIVDRALAAPSEARHAFAAGKMLFRWAASRRYIKHSPADGLVAPAKSRSRDRVLSDREIAKVLSGARQTGYPFGTIVQLLLLTGQRRTEIGSLRKSFIDQGANTITLPPTLTKNGYEHTFPFGPLAAGALSDAISHNEPLFSEPSTTDLSFRRWSRAKMSFDRVCRIDHWTLHDLRRTFATVHARIGTPPHITERILNHQTGTLTPIAKIYNRYSYLDEMREAMCNYEKELQRILSIEKA